MDDVVNRLAKELADAIAVAVSDSPQVNACRTKARDAGYGMRVTLEAVVGFGNRVDGQPVTRVSAAARLLAAGSSLDLTANDKRFLKSLRISITQTQDAVE